MTAFYYYSNQPSRLPRRWNIAVRLVVGVVFASLLCRGTSALCETNDGGADQLVETALDLMHRGQFDDALVKLQQAEAISPNRKTTRKAFEELTDLINSRVDVLLKEAASAFMDQGDGKDKHGYRKAMGRLEEAQKIGGRRDLVLYDLGLTAHRLKNDEAAAKFIQECLDLIPENKNKREVAALLAEIETGHENINVTKALRKDVERFNALVVTDEPYSPTASRKRDAQLCQGIQSLKESLPNSASLLFDLAKCAELDGRLNDVERFLKSYTIVAPAAVDDEDVRIRLESLFAIDAVAGATARDIQIHYANAARALGVRRLNRVRDEYKAALQLDPTLAETQWQLAIFYTSCGNLYEARRILDTLLRNPLASRRQKQAAGEILDTIESDRARYDQIVAEGRIRLTSASGAPSMALRQRSLNDIADLLEPASNLFPNAWEMNDLLAYVYEQTGNQRLALRSLDVLWANDKPVYFDAEIRVGDKTKKLVARKQEPLAAHRVEVMSDSSLRIAGLNSGTIRAAEIDSVETTGAGQLRIELKDGQIVLLNVADTHVGRFLYPVESSDMDWSFAGSRRLGKTTRLVHSIERDAAAASKSSSQQGCAHPGKVPRPFKRQIRVREIYLD
jgi:tetratricopeptide (TPR) repeat protein